MIRLTQRTKSEGTAYACQVCRLSHQGNCEGCGARQMTAFSCPECRRIAHYVGYAAPARCVTCRTTLPALTGLKAEDPIMRAQYHLVGLND